MKKSNFLWIITGFFVCLLWFGCAQQKQGAEVLARVNDYVLTVNDFEDEVQHSPYAGDETLGKEEFLDLMIRKQILIQEAQRQGLDRNESFMKTIERYWKQTLIKELLDKETERVYDEVPKGEQAQAVEEWMQVLYGKADIEINKDALRVENK